MNDCLRTMDSVDQWLDNKHGRTRLDGHTKRRFPGSYQRCVKASTVTIHATEMDDLTGLTPNVSHSLNKSGRWSLPALLQRALAQSSDDASMTILEQVAFARRDRNPLLIGADAASRSPNASVCYEVTRPMPLRHALNEKNAKKLREAMNNGRSVPCGKRSGKATVTVKEALEDLSDEWASEEEEPMEDGEETASTWGGSVEMPLSSFVREAPSSQSVARTELDRVERNEETTFSPKDRKQIVQGAMPGRDDTGDREREADVERGCESVPRECFVTTETLSPEWLAQHYGDRYVEGRTSPRRFLVDITSELREGTRTANHLDAYQLAPYRWCSALVFEECAGDEHDGRRRVRVWPKVCLKCHSIAVESIHEGIVYSVAAVVDAAVRFLACVCWPSMERIDHVVLPSSHRKAQLKWNRLIDRQAAKRDADVSRTKQEDAASAHASAEPTNSDNCSVCLTARAQLTLAGTLLQECQHWCCADCWTRHVRSSIKASLPTVVCPARACDTAANRVTLLRHVDMHEYLVYLSGQLPRGARLCPTTNCNQTLTAGSDALSRAFVQCQCGREMCFKCLETPHWPASCEQARVYHTTIAAVTPEVAREGGSEWIKMALRYRHIRSPHAWSEIERRALRSVSKLKLAPKKRTTSADALDKDGLNLHKFEAVKRAFFARREERLHLQKAAEEFLELSHLLHFVVEYGAVSLDAGKFKDSAARAQFHDAHQIVKLSADRLVDLVCSEDGVQLDRLTKLAEAAMRALRCLTQLTPTAV